MRLSDRAARALLCLVIVPCVGAWASVARADDGTPAVPIAGEILDLAIERCQAGEATQAFALFAAIRAQLQPPPSVERLMSRIEADGCALPAPARQVIAASPWTVQLGGGYDNNATQGITARSLILGIGPDAFALELDDRYQPRASSFTQAAADYRLAVGDRTLLQAAVSQRHNPQASHYDLSTGVLSGQSVQSALGRPVRLQAEWSESWLGGRHYLRTANAGTRWWLHSNAAGSWSVTGAATRLQYTEQPSQDALQLEFGLQREQRTGTALTWGAGVSRIYDRAQGNRPGGDRQGFQYVLSAQASWDAWILRPVLAMTRWTSRDAFFAGLIDERRRSHLSQLVLEAERRIVPGQSVLFQWRQRDNRDSVALYRYQSRAFSIYWRWQP
jgi:hypothetical protein